jgi:hypothetical protein
MQHPDRRELSRDRRRRRTARPALTDELDELGVIDVEHADAATGEPVAVGRQVATVRRDRVRCPPLLGDHPREELLDLDRQHSARPDAQVPG